MIVKGFGKDFTSKGGTLTLPKDSVYAGDDYVNGKEYTRVHDSGWRITGCVNEDYYEWVDEFRASHPQYGNVWGDFQTKVYADSEEGFNHFYHNHTPNDWDRSTM
jgi:hypothetical protein